MERITMAHGSGGEETSRLIEAVFAKYLGNSFLSQMEDSTVVPGSSELAVTTDSFVVTPYIYPGGDIGRLCVCGTVNDLLMSGAVPQYLTCGFILEEGLPLEKLEQIVRSMADTAEEAGVLVAAGDTKVIENRGDAEGGLMINTAGVGFMRAGVQRLLPSGIQAGDQVLVSGRLGDHHAAILGCRLQMAHSIRSDNAPLSEMAEALFDRGLHVHEMRDVTRGGLAGVLNELAGSSGKVIGLEEQDIPVSPEVTSFAGILGLDPLYMGNEGKMVLFVPKEEAQEALEIMRSCRYGEEAALIGSVREPEAGESPILLLHTGIGGTRILGPLYGEGLPRIC